MKYGVFPLGHPEIITENFDENKKYFGLRKCKVLPPRALYCPVLPLKINGKLLFTLCLKCAHEKNQSTCSHSDEERALTGTWVTLELDKAVEKGYKIIKTYEIWHFNEKSQYDPASKTGGLWTGYIDHALKTKQEASGFPLGCETDQQKEKYVDDYYEREGMSIINQHESLSNKFDKFF
jgi:hypothetical protein